MKIGLGILPGLRFHLARRSGHVFSWRRFVTSGPESSFSTPIAVKLRPYQEECIQAVLSNLDRGHRRLGISLATGSGKTVIFTHLIERVKEPKENAGQTLILVHRRELVEQAAKHCTNAYPALSVEIEMGNSHASGAADITIASVQSIAGNRIDKFHPERFKLILVDEAHHIVASQYMKVLNHFGLLEPTQLSPALVGVSATLSRFDGLKLGAALDHIVYHKDYVDMIGEKWLSNVIFTTVQSTADLSKVRRNNLGDFATGELSKAVNRKTINELTVRAWLAKAKGRKSTIVFCVDIDHLEALTSTFKAHGIHARFVTGNTKPSVRSQIVDEFRAGKFPVLLNCGVFTEGTDIPNIDCVLLARPTFSQNLLVQMIGRGMRRIPGKKDCHIIDMISSLENGIVTVPTLFGLDPGHLLEEASPQDIKVKSKGLKNISTHGAVDNLASTTDEPPASTQITPSSIDEHPVTVTFTDYSVYDLIADTSSERHIRALSAFAWVQVNSERFILTNNNGSYISISREVSDVLPSSDAKMAEEPTYTIRYVRKLPSFAADSKSSWRPLARPKEVGTASSFKDAVHAADTFAKEVFVRSVILHRASWRSGDATDGQIKLISKVRDGVDKKTLSKGQAADMITKIQFGAQGRFERAQMLRRQKEKEAMRETKLKRREEVKVGRINS